MGNFKDAQKAQTILNKFYDNLTSLVNELTNWELLPDKPRFEVGNPFPLLVFDDYLFGNIHNGLFVEQLNKCEKDFKKFESIIPSLNELKSDFSQTLNKIQYISDYYINKFETEYKKVLEYSIEIEKEKSIKSGIQINKTDFLSSNQYKRFYDICNSVKATIKCNYIELKNKQTGFTCTLHPDIVKEIYIFMEGESYLSGHLNDFQAIFSKVSIPVENPIKWLVSDNRGTKPGRGNQTALFVFLELILKKVSNQDLIKSKDLFIDEKGKFIENKLLRPDKSKLKEYGFETQLKEILKKADQPKNQ